VEALDKYTVKFTLAQQRVDFISEISFKHWIFPKEIVSADNKVDWKNEPQPHHKRKGPCS
jgi:ABC-type oligopeptide transport system substrate-binding subunit